MGDRGLLPGRRAAEAVAGDPEPGIDGGVHGVVLVAEGGAGELFFDGLGLGRRAVLVLRNKKHFWKVSFRSLFLSLPLFLLIRTKAAGDIENAEKRHLTGEKRGKKSKLKKLTVPQTKSVTSPFSLENLAKASADSTQPMMFPR